MENTLLKVGHPMTDDTAKLSRDKQGFLNFLKQKVGKKKLLVVKETGNEKGIRSELAQFMEENGYNAVTLNGEALTSSDIKALGDRRDEKLLVLVENLSGADALGTIEEASLFRAILDMADPANLEAGFHEMSSFLFFADGSFPSSKLSSVSLTWASETAFYDGRAFREKVIRHMERYKEKFLRLQETEVVKGKSYGHILPEKNYHDNFLPLVREDLITSPYLSGVNWHRFSLHLNSSQILGVNFFYPLIKKEELQGFLKIFSMEEEILYDPEHLSFAKISTVENTTSRRSCFDFHMAFPGGEEVYVISNYTGGCFGRADQESFKEKYESVFKPLLKESDMIEEPYKNEEFFLEEYRYMRSLLHLKEKSRLMVLIPKENFELREKALFFRDQVLTEKGRANFYPVIWEELLEELLDYLMDPELQRYYETELKDKYFRY